MAIRDFLRKLFGEEGTEKKQEIKKIQYGELAVKISAEMDLYKGESKIAKKELLNNVTNFVSQVKNEILILHEIDLNKRKEIEKIKQITLQNLKGYISHLHKLADELSALDSDETKEYANKVISILIKFDNVSRSSFEKATILIGAPLEKIRFIIKEFTTNHNNIISSNNELFERIEALSFLQNIYHRHNSLDKTIKESEKEFMLLSDSLQQTDQRGNSKKEELDAVIASESYKSLLDKKKHREEEISQLNAQIIKIKDKIDLKSLSKIYHDDAKKSKIIEAYRNNFILALDNYSSKDISDIVEFNNPSLDFNVRSALIELNEKRLALKEIPIYPLEDKMHNVKNEINQLNIESNSIKSEIESNKRKQEKLKEKLKSLKSELSECAAKLSWNIENFNNY
ncbi:MAG: hypothetical protein AABW75_02475 [Nanoarchaeota archaeon]